jgi:hypothetical protein
MSRAPLAQLIERASSLLRGAIEVAFAQRLARRAPWLGRTIQLAGRVEAQLAHAAL